MASRYLLVFFICFRASTALILPFLPTPEGVSVNALVTHHIRHSEDSGRKPRHIATILTLLWPQVVGPMHDGIIQEHDYNEIPKTSLENHLDKLRARALQEEKARKYLRDMINFGLLPEKQLTSPLLYHPAEPLQFQFQETPVNLLPFHSAFDSNSDLMPLFPYRQRRHHKNS